MYSSPRSQAVTALSTSQPNGQTSVIVPVVPRTVKAVMRGSLGELKQNVMGLSREPQGRTLPGPRRLRVGCQCQLFPLAC